MTKLSRSDIEKQELITHKADQALTDAKLIVLLNNHISISHLYKKSHQALTDAKLIVLLNNHISTAMWCCSPHDGEGLWYTNEYPEEMWIQGFAS